MKFDARTPWIKFCREESGQDLIEYGLLTGIVTVSSIVIFGLIQGKMQSAYISWESTGQANWEPADPIVTP
jgi:Flp pilus assembly pilin Flp